jgi:phospholipid-binding lipoprotein MlaA
LLRISYQPIRLFLILFSILLLGITGCAHTGKSASPSSMEDQSRQIQDKTVLNSPEQQENDTAEDEMSDDELFLLEDDEETVQTIKDPLHGWNRAMFTFNDRFYFLVAQPVTKGYAWIVHKDVRTVIYNFFHNISMPIRFVNSLLQLKFKSAGTELLRFGINSTMGLIGFLDAAKINYGLEVSDEDFGQTLGTYQLGHGAYFILPFLGPSSIRDSVGFFGDLFLYPIGYIKPQELSLGIYTFESMNSFSFNLNDYDILKEAAVDPYTAVRDAYYQNRKAKVAE